MLQGKAPLHQTTDPGDLHQQIQQMIAAAQGMAPMPPPQMAAPQGAPAPQGMPAPQGAAPQMGGSPQNAQRAMMAQAIRGG